MFVHIYSLRSNAGFRAIAMLLTGALLLWTVGLQFVGTAANAAPQNLTEFSDLLSDSRAGLAANHTIDFVVPNGLVTTETLVITFGAEFDLTAVAGTNEVDVAFDGAATTTAGTAGAGVFGYTGVSGQTIPLTAPTDGVASGTRLTILIGDHTATGDTGQQIVNPTSTTTGHTIDIAGTMQDSGQTQIAVTDNVVVSAAINTTFTFSVLGTDAGFTIPGVATTTTATTSSLALPFGSLTADTAYTLAHQLTVVTNAANGFNVTVEQTGDLMSSTGAIIDSFIDGSYENSPSPWQRPGDSIGDDTTWGHWALTSDDDVFNSGTNDRWVAASTTPRQIFAHASSSDGVTDDVGSTTVGYIIEVTPLQEAGNDYTTNLIYIATPTF